MNRIAWCVLGAVITGSTALLGVFGAYDNKAVVLVNAVAYAVFGFAGIALRGSGRGKQDEV